MARCSTSSTTTSAGNVSGRRADGTGILNHAFGDRRAAAEEAVAKKSGLDLSSIGPLLTTLAPIVMSLLGRKQRQSGGGFGLDDLLGGVLGGQTGGSTADRGAKPVAGPR